MSDLFPALGEWHNPVSGVTLRASQGITNGNEGSPWLIFKVKPNGSLSRRSIPAALSELQFESKEEALAELNEYCSNHQHWVSKGIR